MTSTLNALACPAQFPCAVASLLKPFPLIEDFCSLKYPLPQATVTATGTSKSFTTTVATTTLLSTVATSHLFLTQTTRTLTSTVDDGVQTIIVTTTAAPGTSTVLNTVTRPTITTITVTVTPSPLPAAAAASAELTDSVDLAVVKKRSNGVVQFDGDVAYDASIGDFVAVKSMRALPILPRAASTCKSNAITPGCGFRTCKSQCGVDRPYGDYLVFITNSFASCSHACAQDTRCSVAAFQSSTGRCSLKSPSARSAQNSRGIDIVECTFQPSSVLGAGADQISAICSCLETRQTVTVTSFPVKTVSVTATAYSKVTTVKTSFGVATSIATIHRGTTKTSFRTKTPPARTITVIATTVYKTSTITKTVTTTTPPTPTNMIINPSFEYVVKDPNNGQESAPPWEASNTRLISIDNNADDAHTGTHSLSFTIPTNESPGWLTVVQYLPSINFGSNSTLNLWYQVRTRDPALAECQIYVQIGLVRVFSAYFDESQPFQYVNSGDVYFVPDDAFSLNFEVGVKCFVVPNYNASVLVDDIFFAVV